MVYPGPRNALGQPSGSPIFGPGGAGDLAVKTTRLGMALMHEIDKECFGEQDVQRIAHIEVYLHLNY